VRALTLDGCAKGCGGPSSRGECKEGHFAAVPGPDRPSWGVKSSASEKGGVSRTSIGREGWALAKGRNVVFPSRPEFRRHQEGADDTSTTGKGTENALRQGDW